MRHIMQTSAITPNVNVNRASSFISPMNRSADFFNQVTEINHSNSSDHEFDQSELVASFKENGFID